MIGASDAYRLAEETLGLPPVERRSTLNQNPPEIGFWALVAEDFRTHDRDLFDQGFWAVFVHRFGNWRMSQPKIVRAPATLIYRILFKLVEILAGISLWYPVRLGRRVRIWHHSGIVISARAIGDDTHIRQNVTIGVRGADSIGALPIIGARVDIGAGAALLGPILVGDGARIGANAVLASDAPAGSSVSVNPARVKTRRGDPPGADPEAPAEP
jgi:serine O-acetyltransferase